jgi:hypothetical protein
MLLKFGRMSAIAGVLKIQTISCLEVPVIISIDERNKFLDRAAPRSWSLSRFQFNGSERTMVKCER